MEYEKVDYEIDNNTKNINDIAKALIINVGFSSPSLLD